MGSAPLAPVSLSASGTNGLNLQASNTILESVWATKAQNLVFDNTNRLSTRLGWLALNATPMSGSPVVSQVFEYTPVTGANQVVSTGGNKLYKGTTTLTDITGAVTVTADNWKIVNFNGNAYGLQTSHNLIVWTGSGNFANVTAASGTVPDGNELLSAFGRLWGTDSTGQVIKYCNLLDATNWNIAGAGSINLTSVWGTGNDAVVALASFNNLLVVFGNRNIILFEDGSGSKLGLDPINIRVVDIVPGIGCTARDSVQNVNGDDLVFLAASGVQSLKRVIFERSNAIQNLSLNVRDSLNVAVSGVTPSTIRSTYNAYYGVYLLCLPAAAVMYVFDTKRPLQDGTWRVTMWDHFTPTALVTLHDSLTTYSGLTGKLFQYTGNLDNSTAFRSTFESGWLDLGPDLQNRQKALKRLSAMFSASGATVMSYKWAYDFSDDFRTAQVSIVGTTSNAMWGVSQWGLDSWGGGIALYNVEVPGNSTGQYIKVGIDCPSSTVFFSLNQMQIYAKIGRIT